MRPCRLLFLSVYVLGERQGSDIMGTKMVTVAKILCADAEADARVCVRERGCQGVVN